MPAISRKKLEEIKGIEIMRDRLDINMVFFKLDQGRPEAIVGELYREGIKINPPEGDEWRLVTNLDVSRSDLDTFIARFTKAVKSC